MPIALVSVATLSRARALIFDVCGRVWQFAPPTRHTRTATDMRYDGSRGYAMPRQGDVRRQRQRPGSRITVCAGVRRFSGRGEAILPWAHIGDTRRNLAREVFEISADYMGVSRPRKC